MIKQQSSYVVGLIIILLWSMPLLFLSVLFKQVSTNDYLDFFHGPYFYHVLKFTILQAFFSALLSLIPAIFIALALYRRDFLAKQLLLKMCLLIFVLPSLVVVIAVIGFYGKGGWLQSALQLLGINFDFHLYGWPYILIAHVFFNLPLAVKFIYSAVNQIPETQRKIMTQLNMTMYQEFIFVQWAYIRRQVISVFLLIFMICFASFVIVLTLGGGPKYTTLEVYIYQSITNNALSQAALLAIVQMSLCLILASVLQFAQRSSYASRIDTFNWKRRYTKWQWVCVDGLFLGFFIVFLFFPLVMLVINGFNRNLLEVINDSVFWHAVWNSLIIAFISACFSVFLASFLSRVIAKYSQMENQRFVFVLSLSGRLILSLPTMVLSLGCYLLFYRNGLPESPYLAVILINTLMAIPFLLSSLEPVFIDNHQRYKKLQSSLSFSWWQQIYWLRFKALIFPLRQALALAMLISIGDYGVISIFGSQYFQTLPSYLQSQLSGYNFSKAQSTVILMLILYGLIFYSLVRGKDG